MLTVYAYAGCGTCRKALSYLRERAVAFQERAIRETPPSPAELRRLLEAVGGNLKRLFNTSGQDYRALGIGEQLKTLSEDQALALLASNGNLCKRPMVVGPGLCLVGFQPEAWASVAW